MGREYLDLYCQNGTKLFVNPSKYENIKNELIDFLDGQDHLCTEEFAKKVMFSQELAANNQAEGYKDDVEAIKEALQKNKKKHILNLYKGYSYILKNKTIDKESLKELYQILSEGLLSDRDLSNMGDYYRQGPVYILKNGRLDDSYSEGVKYQNIEKLLENYFNFLNKNVGNDITDRYIQSQILHYYFVYIHPYFDVNGRTSRTLAMWNLLNHKSYPYIIFNRGIVFKGHQYDNVIRDVTVYNNLTYFIEYMLKTVKEELEKEYVMHIESELSNVKFDALDYQTLLYFLSMNGMKTVLDFVTFYNRFNEKKSPWEIYKTMIVPLLDKGILDIERETNKSFNFEKNKVLKLRYTNEIDKNKVKHIEL